MYFYITINIVFHCLLHLRECKLFVVLKGIRPEQEDKGSVAHFIFTITLKFSVGVFASFLQYSRPLFLLNSH